MIRRSTSRQVSLTSDRCVIPPLFTRMSTRPCWLSTESAAVGIAAVSVRSSGRMRCRSAWAQPVRTASRRSPRRADSTSVAPRAAKALANAAPMPGRGASDPDDLVFV